VARLGAGVRGTLTGMYIGIGTVILVVIILILLL
jgi:hypothetical protein